MEQILKLENTDDIASIKNRIDFALPPPILTAQAPTTKEKPARRRLLLIVPRKNKAMRSLVNMKLLARIAKTRAIEIAIVSGHPTVRDYAKEAGIKAFGSHRIAKWSRWVASQTPVTPPEETLPPIVQTPDEALSPGEAPPPSEAPPPDESPFPSEVHPKNEKEDKAKHKSTAHPPETQKKSPPKRIQKKKYVVVTGSGRIGCLQHLGALVSLLALALALVLGVIALTPQATVTLTPIAQPVEAELIVKANPNTDAVDFKTLTFPARIDQVELALSGEIKTIETELAPVGLGRGSVTFINRTEENQIIPISTTVSTSAGERIEFVTVQTATIPAGIGAITYTRVIAVKTGPGGNVKTGQINHFVDSTYALLARVINEQALVGGTMEPAKIVVPDDKERLQAHLRQKIQQQGLTQLQESLEEQEFISPETLQVVILDMSYEEFSGDFSDTFSGEMQAVVRGTVVGGYNANRLALAALQAQIPPGFELDIEGLHFGAGEVLDVQEGVVIFKIFATGKYAPVIEAYEVAQQIAWLPIGEAQALLDQQYTLVAVPGVELKPDWAVEWLGRLPYYPLRINVVIGDAVTLVADGD